MLENLVAGIIGLVVGIIMGMFGVGGGFLMTPALMIILGIPGAVAVGTSLTAIFTMSNFAIIERRGKAKIDIKLALTIGIGGVAGVLVGAQLLELLKHVPKLTILGRQQDMVQYVLLCLFLVLLVVIAIYLGYDYKRTDGKPPIRRIGLFAGLRIPPYMHFKSLEQPRMSVFALLILGFCVGILTGFMGVGGGVVLLPALVYLVGQRTSKAVGTSLLLVWISSLIAVIKKGAAGDVSVPLFIALLAGGIIGTFLGTNIGLKLAGPKIRLYFVCIIVVAAGLVAYKLSILTFC